MHSQLQLPLWLTHKLAEKELVKLKGTPQAYSGSMLEDIEADAANAKVKRRGGLYFYDVGLKIRDIREKACVGAGRRAGGRARPAGRLTDAAQGGFRGRLVHSDAAGQGVHEAAFGDPLPVAHRSGGAADEAPADADARGVRPCVPPFASPGRTVSLTRPAPPAARAVFDKANSSYIAFEQWLKQDSQKIQAPQTLMRKRRKTWEKTGVGRAAKVPAVAAS